MNVVILDTETHELEGRLIELAWLDPKTGESFERRYNPGCKIEPGAMAVHHITDADVADSPDHLTANIPADVQYVIGHKVDYDIAVLRRTKIDVTKVKAICTLALSRKAWPELKSHSLGALVYALHDDQAIARDMLKNAHSALADVRVTAWLLERILKKLGLGDNPQLLFLASEDARVPRVWPLGKYKGMPISDTVVSDPQYVKWALAKMENMDSYLRAALTKALQSIL